MMEVVDKMIYYGLGIEPFRNPVPSKRCIPLVTANSAQQGNTSFFFFFFAT